MIELAGIAEDLRKEIYEKGILPRSYIAEKCKELKKGDRLKIEKILESDPAIVLDGDVFKLISIISSTEQELLKEINYLEKIEMRQDSIKSANTLYRGIIVIANPQNAIPDFINRLYEGRNNLITAIHISPESTINIVHHLISELELTEKELNRLTLEGKLSGKEISSLENKRKFLKSKIEKLTSEELVPFKLNITFMLEDVNAEDLDFSTNKLMTYLRKLGFIVKSAINYQKDVLKTIIPSGANFVKRRHIIVTNDLLSSIFPFVKR